MLGNGLAFDVFERELEAVRGRYGFVVAGYVLMPEHFHLLTGEPMTASLSVALQVLKQQTSKKLKTRGEDRFWQRRYYDFNVYSESKRVEKLRYMHRNPVVRGLVEKPEDWPWSSFRHYAMGEIGTVEADHETSQFTFGPDCYHGCRPAVRCMGNNRLESRGVDHNFDPKGHAPPRRADTNSLRDDKYNRSYDPRNSAVRG